MRNLVLLRAEGMGQVSGELRASSLSDPRSASVPLRVEGALGRPGSRNLPFFGCFAINRLPMVRRVKHSLGFCHRLNDSRQGGP